MAQSNKAHRQLIEVSKPVSHFVHVEFPGTIKNKEKVLAAYGGEEEISKVYQDEAAMLPLKFTPNGKPVWGERKKCQKLVIKETCTGKRKKGQNGAVQEIKKYELVGLAETSYIFNGMADMHHVLKPEKVYDLLNPDFFCEEKGIGDEDDQVSNMPPESLRLVPPFIANERHPLHYRFENKPAAIPTKERKEQLKYISDKDEIPKAVENPEDGLSEKEKLLLHQLQSLFSRRPMWQRHAIEKHVADTLKDSPELRSRFASVASRVAYRFSNGPFRSTFAALGYNPRIPENRGSFIYQVFDFRLRQSQQPTQGSASNRETPAVWNPGQRAFKKQYLLQLCDIHVLTIQQILQRYTPREEYHEHDGWLLPKVFKEIRKAMLEELEKQEKEPVDDTEPTLQRLQDQLDDAQEEAPDWGMNIFE
eukprot:m.270974 g.270974  ORF g.270974 m.270974 type:complete len:420 (-) comp16265_c2_seq1:53-1312(-)